MSTKEDADILIVIAKSSHEQGLVEPLKSGFGNIRVLTRPSLELLKQTLAECSPRLLICDLDSHALSIRSIISLIELLKLSTHVVATAPAASTRAVISAMAQGARDLVSPADSLHLQLVSARELGILKNWCEKHASKLAPFVEDADGHAELDGFRIVNCDATLSRMLGTPADSLRNTSLLQYVDGDDHRVVKQLINRCIQGEDSSESVLIRLIKPDGAGKRIQISVEASYKDEKVSLMLTAQTPLETAPAAAPAKVAEPLDPAVTKRVVNALKQNQMSLVVQPISELVGQANQKPSSKLDIYVMLKDAEGELPARKFVREARASGLIRYVDRWVVHNACKLLRANLPKEGPMLLFLRLSRQSLHEANLPQMLSQEAAKNGVPLECLSFELSSSDTHDLTDAEIGVLEAVKQAGFRLALGGIGTSPTAQKLLKQLPVDFIKLDPKLTAKAQDSEVARKLVQELVHSANARGQAVIATQVPNATAMAALWNLGVHYVQGNYLHEPEIVMRA